MNKNNESEDQVMKDTEDYKKEENFFKKLQSLLKPHILRRFKRDVFKDFPKKKEIIINIDMTDR